MRGYGSIIRNARKKKGFTQTDLALKVGVAKNTIYDWEKENYSPTTVPNITALEETLGFDRGYLLDILYPNPPQPSIHQG